MEMLSQLTTVLIVVCFIRSVHPMQVQELRRSPVNYNNSVDDTSISIQTNGQSVHSETFGLNSYDRCKQCYNCQCHQQFCFGKRFLDFHIGLNDCHHYRLDCSDHNGPRDGHWSSWEHWSDCFGLCMSGHAKRTRNRHCSNPEPRNCGAPCPGEASQEDHWCLPKYCPHVDHQQATTTTKGSEINTHVTAAPTTKTPTTTTEAQVYTSCSKLCTVSAVVDAHPILQTHARQCSGSTRGSSEALPLHCCGNLDRRLTQQGVNVMSQCETFPHYTAVASFQGGGVEAGTEGVFVGCLPAPEVGFQLIRQDCNTLPTLVHVNTTQVIYGSPYGYFALV